VRQRAIDKVMRRWGFDHELAVVTYLPDLDKDGTIDLSQDIIYVGKQAYRHPGWLGSVIGHERVHITQRKEKRLGQSGTCLRMQNEREAYHWQIVNADRFRLTEAERRRVTSEYQQLTWTLCEWCGRCDGLYDPAPDPAKPKTK
jgi:hypothetical protein